MGYYDFITYYEWRERVRLIGIDTTERGEPGFYEAIEFIEEELEFFGTQIWLEASGDERDRFGRLRRYVWLDVPLALDDSEEISDLLLNQLLLDFGYAIIWIPNSGTDAVEVEEVVEATSNIGSHGGEIGESGREYFRGVTFDSRSSYLVSKLFSSQRVVSTRLTARASSF